MADEDDKSASTESSCGLPFNTSKLVGVHYPGYVKNVSKVLETLGGEESVSKTYSKPSIRLEMAFRPSDPYCKVLCADRFNTSNLLLRVKRRRRRNKQDGQEPGEWKYEQEILGIVDTTYRFEAMVDFQYLANDIPDMFQEVHGSELLETDMRLHLPPAVFSRFDRPVDYKYRSEPQPQPGPKASAGDNLDSERMAGTRTRARRPAYAKAVMLDAKEIPSDPIPGAVQSATKVNDGQDLVIKRLFTNRPIWSRGALECHLNVNKERLKQLLPTVAYYWLNGPWRTLWVRFGYDPRTTPSAKIYQMLDFRIGSRKVAENLPFEKKGSTLGYNLPNVRQNMSSSAQADFTGSRAATTKDKDDDLPYVYNASKMPKQKQVFYQLCDLHDSEIQQLVCVNDGKEAECHDRDGWCIPGTHAQIREILVQRTIAMVENRKAIGGEGAEATAPVQNIEEAWGAQEGLTNFLEFLENDNDVEGYDIFEDGDAEGETDRTEMEAAVAEDGAEGSDDETEEAE